MYIKDNCLNDDVYLNLLNYQFIPVLDNKIDIHTLDRTPPHYAHNAMVFLNEQFSNYWISRKCKIEWLGLLTLTH